MIARIKAFSCFIILCSYFFINIAEANSTPRELALRFFSPIPPSMPNSEHDTKQQVSLGRSLYFETALSANDSQSCNSCHDITNHSGVDHLPTSPGALNVKGRRNSPSTFNAGFQFVQFWDGRADTLEAQARSPILNPAEMGLSSEEEAVMRLRDKGYQDQFSKAFSQSTEPLSFKNILRALGAFQRTLITKDRFDKFLLGDDSALNELEKRGIRTFIVNGCNACHNGPLLGGNMFTKMGVVNAYPNTTDKGRAEVTGIAGDNFLFKVPQLRNVANTYPYFHDGAGLTLEQAIVDTGWHQLGIKLNAIQVREIEAFLNTLNHEKQD